MKFKVTTLIGSLGISLVIFLGLMYSEIDHFNKFNPPAEAVKPSIIGSIKTSTDETLYGLTPSYEFAVLFPNTDGNFSQSINQINDGLMYINGSLNSWSKLNQGYSEIPKPFNTSTAVLENGWLKIEALNMAIFFKNGDVLVSRKAIKKVTDIYALSHPIEVWMDGMKEPFVIPPENQVRLEDFKINKNTARLFYSKLRKKSELNLQKFSLDDFAFSQSTTYPSLNGYAEKALWSKSMFKDTVSKSHARIHYFLQKNVKNVRSGLETLVQGPQIIGYQLAPKGKKVRQCLSEILGDLAFFEFTKRIKPNRIKENIPKLKAQLLDLNSKDLSITETQDYQNITQTLTYNANQTEPNQAHFSYTTLWHDIEILTEYETWKHWFFLFESSVSQRNLVQTSKYLKVLNQTFSKWQTENIPASDITRYRRIVSEMLKNQSYLQNPAFLDLYTALIKKELLTYPKGNALDEIKLEMAQDTLFFLHQFMMITPKQNLLPKLKNIYQLLNINELSKSIGRDNIFSEDELEILEFISLGGVRPLSQKDIERIKSERAAKEKREQILASADSALEKDTKEENHGIESKEDLIRYFEDQKFQTHKLKVFQNNSRIIHFKSLKYNNLKVSGSFETQQQRFRDVRAGEQTITSVSTNKLTSYIQQIQAQQLNQISTTSEFKCSVSQKSVNAKLERLVTRKKLEQIGLEVSINDIIVCDRAYQRFIVNKATRPDYYELSFEYMKGFGKATKVKVKYGSNETDFGTKPFRMEQLFDIIDKQLQELYPGRFKQEL